MAKLHPSETSAESETRTSVRADLAILTCINSFNVVLPSAWIAARGKPEVTVFRWGVPKWNLEHQAQNGHLSGK
jgi:hypothetical protein